MDPGLRFAGSTNGANSITAAKVVVHHPAGLHEGVADRGSDEGETALFQVLAHGFGFRRRDRQFPVMVGAAAVDARIRIAPLEPQIPTRRISY